MKTLAQLNKEIQRYKGLPHELANLLVECSGYYAQNSEQFADYEIRRAKYITALNQEGKSIASAEQSWLTEEDGKMWIYLNYYLKSLKIIHKAINSSLYVANSGVRMEN